MATKRAAPEGGGPVTKKQMTGYQIRLLLTTPEVAVVIGRGGANVKAIRAETGAYVSVLWPKTAERVCSVQGSDLTSVTAALGKIVEHMASLAGEGKASVDLRLLGHENNVGCLIGRGGSIISQAVRDHKVRSIRVAKQSCAESTEKIVTITGEPQGVTAAALWVITRLEENPVEEGTATRLFKPTTQGLAAAAAQQGVGIQPQAQQPVQYSTAQYSAAQYSAAQYSAAQYSAAPSIQYVPVARPNRPVGQPSPAPAPAPTPAPSNSSNQTTATLSIPAIYVAGLIGKGGSVISGIKKRSGAHVSIQEANTASNGQGVRLVSVSGSMQAIQLATQAIQDRITLLGNSF